MVQSGDRRIRLLTLTVPLALTTGALHLGVDVHKLSRVLVPFVALHETSATKRGSKCAPRKRSDTLDKVGQWQRSAGRSRGHSFVSEVSALEK